MGKNSIILEKLKKNLLSDPKVKEAYDELEPEYQIARQVIEARMKRNMTQQDLAAKMGTGQAVISRLESMRGRPTISFLERLSQALRVPISVNIRP